MVVHVDKVGIPFLFTIVDYYSILEDSFRLLAGREGSVNRLLLWSLIEEVGIIARFELLVKILLLFLLLILLLGG